MFKIDLAETFEPLSRAPIVEAAIGVTARAVTPWEESSITEQFKRRLSEYPNIQSHREIRHEFKVAPDRKSEQAVKDLGWRGLRCVSEDKLNVVQFNRDGIAFSRLKPYQSWDLFCQEGLRSWGLFNDIAKPTDIQRIGLRFINRIELPQDRVELEDYLENSPEPPKGMDITFAGFVHHNTLAVPGYPYVINLIQTIQPGQGADDFWGIILDIDVSTTQPVANQDMLGKHLAQMRWLKNKAFFGSITPKTLEMIK